jgi:hypothetical protein
MFSSSYANSLFYVLTSRPLTWRRYLYVTSFTALIPCLNAINFPLPFHLQLPMVLLKLACDLGLAVPAVHCALVRAAEASTATYAFSKAACELTVGMVETVGIISSPLCVIGAGSSSSVCDSGDNGLAFVVFSHLVLGELLPLCISYWFEQGVKLRWLRMVATDTRGMGSSVLGRIVWIALWTGACGTISQLLVDFKLFLRGGCAVQLSMPPA